MPDENLDEMDRLAAEINSNLQVIKQTDAAIIAYLDGWLSEEAYNAAISLRDACRADVARLCSEIEEAGGIPPVEAPTKDGYPIAGRMGITDDAIVEVAELAAENAENYEILAQAFTEFVEEQIGGDE